MRPVKEFLTEENLEDLASRSYFRYGKQIAKDGEIEIIKQNTFNIIAKVKQGTGHESRTVELMSTPKGFRWKCTCTNKKNLFCQHCVAAGLFQTKPKENNPV